MASIRILEGKDGKKSYNVMIRKKGQDISKTFSNEEDANVYVYYKERLIELMDNFDVPIQDRVTLEDVFELKRKSLPPETDRRMLSNLENSLDRIKRHLPDKYLNEISFEEWQEGIKNLYAEPVYRGSKTEAGKRSMAPKTLRNILAYASSSISHAQSLGIPVENYALRLIQSLIPILEKEPDNG